MTVFRFQNQMLIYILYLYINIEVEKIRGQGEEAKISSNKTFPEVTEDHLAPHKGQVVVNSKSINCCWD